MRPNAGEFVPKFTATPRGLLNWRKLLVSLLMSVQFGEVALLTAIWKDDAPPRLKVCVPLASGPRFRVLAPPSKLTVTPSADSFRMNETVTLLLVIPEAYGSA